MNKSLRELADLVGGKLKGREDITIKGVTKIEEAKKGEITFAVSQKFLLLAEKSEVSAIIVSEQLESLIKPIIQVADPRLAFAKILEVFAPPPPEFKGIHPSAIIDKRAKIGERVNIGPYCIIEEGVRVDSDVYISGFCYLGKNVLVGEGSFLHPKVSLLDRVSIGKRGVVHSGATIGSDGFGFVKREDGSYYKIPQTGKVVIGDDVEIGANVTIDRATTGETRIGKGTKIDNLVHIAHNVNIGQNVVIVALVGISGSCQIGDGAILAGQAGINDHVSIGANAIIGAKAAVTKDVPSNAFFIGIPARHHLAQKRIIAVTHRLPELAKKVQKLEKLIGENKNVLAKDD